MLLGCSSSNIIALLSKTELYIHKHTETHKDSLWGCSVDRICLQTIYLSACVRREILCQQHNVHVYIYNFSDTMQFVVCYLVEILIKLAYSRKPEIKSKEIYNLWFSSPVRS